MFANRISFWLNLKGPSNAMDQACCSSSCALTQGYDAIARGDCEAAIVATANLYLHPQTCIHMGRIIINCPDGKTKCFDEKADGSCKSEAVQVLFLQKAKHAYRIYAEVIHTQNEYVNAYDKGTYAGLYRNPATLSNFLKKFYDDINISPEVVEYVEANGAALLEEDKAELEAISNVFCKDRSSPLLVGSVMSNIGYTGAASGICSVVKALIAYKTGKIPANLHLSDPRKDIPALQDGRIRIVTENEPFGRGYVAINNHSYTGCTAHILLKGRYKAKVRFILNTHLVNISARQERGVQKIFDDLKSRPVDPEELALFTNIHKKNISGHLARGFIILDTDLDQNTVSLKESAKYFDNARRPLWFVYSGMGSQWPGMGTQLMRIPIFAAAIERCQRVLEPHGIDLIHIITSEDKNIFDNILNSFVGIVAMQIAFTDVLRELGLVPDKIIGHSLGELSCAYADGCFTAEETILCAYSRGLVSIQTPFIKGSMVAVGLGYEQVKEMLPPEIEVACHNSAESSTISGPADVMKEFVSNLNAKGIFAKQVPCGNIAYHSRYISEAGPQLRETMLEIIKEPKERSERWVSTSVPQEMWESPIAKTSSAEYHTNNLLSPVLFEEACSLIPDDAVLLEVAAHGLLQAILKRSLPVSCKYIPLTRRGHADNVLMVLEAIGTLYMEGYNSETDALYPKIEFPVSTETPMLSHLVEWAHDEKWPFLGYSGAEKKRAAAADYIICLPEPEYSYLKGNVVRGKNVYPFAAALEAVWETLAMYTNTAKNQFPVTFHDVELFAEPILSDRTVKINVSIHKGHGYFEVLEDKSKVVTGYITSGTSKDKEELQMDTNEMIFNNDDIYEIFNERDYSYERAFRSMHAVNKSFTEAQLIWDENWVTLIDAMIQMNILRQKHHAVSKRLRIRKLSIDTEKHHSATTTALNGKNILEASVDELSDTTRCGGITLESIRFKNLPRRRSDAVDLQTLQLIPYFNSSPNNLKTAVQVCLQIVAENVNKNLLNIVEIVNSAENIGCFRNVQENDVADVRVIYKQLDMEEMTREQLSNVDLVLVQGLSMDNNLCNDLYSVLETDVLILNAEQNKKYYRPRTSTVFRIVASQNAGDVTLNLGKWRPKTLIPKSMVTVRTQSDLSLLLAQRRSMRPNEKLQVITSYPPVPGIRDLIDNWRKEQEQNGIYLVMCKHNNNWDQSNMMELPELDLAVNILHEGKWGGEYYLPLKNVSALSSNVTLRSKDIGDLESLSWIEAPELTASGIPVKVHYAGLNTVDVMKATGVYRIKEGDDVDDISYGMDFSGVTDNGVRVMGLIESGSVSSRVTGIRNLLWPVPNHWTLEDAATVPMPYAMAFYCLAIKTRMVRNQSILVHSGAGALGQAVISIALAHGLEVFTTVGDIRKKHFLRKLFPELKDDHIGYSRDSSFRDMIHIATKGKGVTYVINSLKGTLKEVSNKCAAEYGVVIDSSQIHHCEVYSYPMFNMTRGRSYSRIDLASVFCEKFDMLKLQYLISEGISQGYVRPLSRVTYEPSEVRRAFRLLEASQNRGRVLLTLNATPKAQTRSTCSSDRTHVVICDDKTLGLHIANRLLKRGAKKLLLQLPNLTPRVLYQKELWQETGAVVNIYTNHLDVKDNVDELLVAGSNMGTVEGIHYIIAEPCNDIKLNTLNHLDTTSRMLCPSLQNFTLISVDDKFGNDLCISRVQQQLPATKISLYSTKMVDEPNLEPSVKILSSSAVCDAFERALICKETIIKVQARKPGINLLREIANIADVKLPEIVNDANTLRDFGINIDKVQRIAALLREEYNHALNEEEILELTVEKTRELDQVFNGKARKIAEGIEMFFTYIDSDELISGTDIVLLPTKADDSMLMLNDLDITKSYLCIIPGLEGYYERFRNLCERLKMPALVIQPDPDIVGSIKKMAARNAQILLKKLSIKDNFYLMGYESGVLITLETAVILEEHGLTGTIYLMGGSADHMKNFIKAELQQYGNEKELQKAILRHMYKLMSNNDLSLDIDEGLEWDECVELCVKHLFKRKPITAEYAKLNLKTPFYRIKEVLEYEPQMPPLKSKLVLLQPCNMKGDDVPAALQKYTVQPLVVHNLSLPLSQGLEDLQSAVFINQHLDENILEIFMKTNLCDTYLISADDLQQMVDE